MLLASNDQMMGDISDIQLIEKIKTGDMACFETLVNRHKNFAYMIAFRVLNSREDAEEIAHDAFVKLLDILKGFKGDAKFTTWFYRIVLNMAIGRTRKKKIRTEDISNPSTVLTDHSTNDDTAGLNREDRTKYLELAMGKLSDEERVLLELYYYQELSMDEIMEITGMDKNTMKVKIFRARKKMAKTLGKILSGEVMSIY